MVYPATEDDVILPRAANPAIFKDPLGSHFPLSLTVFLSDLRKAVIIILLSLFKSMPKDQVRETETGYWPGSICQLVSLAREGP